MAKYKLTITDLETGEVELDKTCDGLIGAIISQNTGDVSSPVSFSCMSKLPAIDIISLLEALEKGKGYLLARKPVIAQLYDMKDMFFSERISVDITGLKKQVGAE